MSKTKRRRLKIPRQLVSKSRGNLKNLPVPWLVPIASVVVLVVLYHSPLFRLKHLTCRFDGQDCAPAVTADLNRYQGKSTFTTKASDVVDHYRQAVPEAGVVQVSIKLPGSLDLRLSRTKLIAYVSAASASAALQLSDNHRVMGIVEVLDPQIPLITDESAYDLTVGQVITDPTINFALDLIEQLDTSFIPFDSIMVENPETLLVTLESGHIAVFSSALEVSRQLTSLQVILTKAKIDQEVRYLDVRFDQPVLRSKL
jgi:hypothetical protein